MNNALGKIQWNGMFKVRWNKKNYVNLICTGAVAILLGFDSNNTPISLRADLIRNAIQDAVNDAGADSPNRLLYIGTGIDIFIPTPTPSTTSPGPLCPQMQNMCSPLQVLRATITMTSGTTGVLENSDTGAFNAQVVSEDEAFNAQVVSDDDAFNAQVVNEDEAFNAQVVNADDAFNAQVVDEDDAFNAQVVDED